MTTQHWRAAEADHRARTVEGQMRPTKERARRAAFYFPRKGWGGREVVDELCCRVPLRIAGRTVGLIKYEVAE